MTVIRSNAKALRLKAVGWMSGKSATLTILPRITWITRIKSTIRLHDSIREIREIRGPILLSVSFWYSARSHPVAPRQTPSHPVKPRQTWSHLGGMGVLGRMARPMPVKPGPTRSQPVAPGQTSSFILHPSSFPVAPRQTWSHLGGMGVMGWMGRPVAVEGTLLWQIKLCFNLFRNGSRSIQ
jgi:hypothetical protein